MTTSRPIENETPDQLSRGVWLLPLLAALLVLLLPFMPAWVSGEKVAWYLTRASGVTAYLLLAGSTLWGLLLSTRLIKQAIPPALSLAMHNVLSWSALALTAFHALILLFDNYLDYRIVDLLVPFIGPYEPLWVGLGVIGMYIALLTSVSFEWRKRIGQDNWRRLHYLTFVAFGLVTLHGWMAGSDALGLLYTTTGTLVLFLTAYRVLTAVRGHA